MSQELREFDRIVGPRDSRTRDTPTPTPLYLAGAHG